MSTGTIKNTTPEMFTLESNSSLATSGGTGIYFPDSGLVVIMGAASNTSNIGTTTVLATVPSKYRPSENRSIYGRFNTDANVNSIASVVVRTNNGAITEGSSGYVRSIDFWGVYKI